MPYILPLAILAVVAFLLVLMPWGRRDPRHEFLLEMCDRLAVAVPCCKRADAEMPASEEIHDLEYRTAAGHPDSAGGPHV
jgi:hypothetical protein